MSFYPILSAPGCTGFTTLCNFPPNNWEDKSQQKKLINLTWAEENYWRSITLGELDFGSMLKISRSDLNAHLPIAALPLLSLGLMQLPSRSDILPDIKNRSKLPAWRATLGLMTSLASTCYQGEIDPFSSTGSLLSFAPFIQYGEDIENYLLLINLEKSPQSRSSFIEIYDSANPSNIKNKIEVKNNNISVIFLNNLNFRPDQLPVIICKNMSGIPLYFSKTRNGAFLSLEHTHPPASYVVHGNRWDSQKILKMNWFKKLGNE
jgi:hypothetical protein